MTSDDLQKQAKLIADSQDKFVATIYELSGLVDSLIQHQSSFMKYLTTWRDLFISTRDLMNQQMDLHRESLEIFKSISKAVTDSAVSTNENNERLEKLITKFESYFGDGAGLNYEN